MPVKPTYIVRIQRAVQGLEFGAPRLPLEEEDIVNSTKMPSALSSITLRIRPLPNDFVPEVPGAKYSIDE